jgi:hypothetical protein
VLHPRGEDGRFVEASQPRIFNRPEEVGSYESWGGGKRWGWKDPQTGETTGRLLTGEPIAPENVPKTLYHVTTAATAVESSGVLLGLLEDGGLGGGQAPGVSFTADPQDAVVIQRELRRAVQIARGDLTIEDLAQFAREDEREAGLSEGALKPALDYGRGQWDGNEFILRGQYVPGKGHDPDTPHTPQELERVRRSLLKDAFSAYLQTREEAAAKALGQKEWPYSVPMLKNPLILGRQEHLAKLTPEDIQTLTVESAQIPAGALVTTGSDKFLHEVRVYADVPRPKRLHSIAKKDFDESLHPREPAGSGDISGQFTGSGHTGAAMPDPVLAGHAKAGIAKVETLLPQAIEDADYTGTAKSWSAVDSGVQNEVRQEWENEQYEDGVDVDTSYLDEETKKEVQKDNQALLDQAVEVTVRNLQNVKPFKDTDPTLPMRPPEEWLEEAFTPKEFELHRTLDPDTIDYGEGEHEDGPHQVALDLDALRFTSGEPLTPDEQKMVRDQWDAAYKDAYETALEKAFESNSYSEQRNELEQQQVSDAWDNLSDEEKLDYMRSKGKSVGLDTGEPDTWVTGVETGAKENEDYARTHAIALKLTELRTDELRKERGLLDAGPVPTYEIRTRQLESRSGFVGDDPNKVVTSTYYTAVTETGRVIAEGYTEQSVKNQADSWASRQSTESSRVGTPEMIEDLWRQWKLSSSEGIALSMQLAAAQEFGGLHRLTPDELKTALDAADEVGGMENIKAYVRAQWEVTQMVMAKAGETKVEVYRGLMLEGDRIDRTPNVKVDSSTGESVKRSLPTNISVQQREGVFTVTFEYAGQILHVEKKPKAPKVPYSSIVDLPKEGTPTEWEDDATAVQRRIEYYHRTSGKELIKLPELMLRRAGAQSTTGTASVANNWNGVGELPPNPVRVVLRIEAPATSVLSLPVYGQNDQSEHESVLIGTKDRWLWDAWRKQAPLIKTIPISTTVRKAETGPLVIDLQDEDRGKPHWMSSVNWSTVQAVAKTYLDVLKWEESEHPREPQGSAIGGQFTSAASQPDAGAGGGRGSAVSPSAAVKGRPDAVPAAQAIADSYNARQGLPPVQHGYVAVDEPRAGTIADAYDALPEHDEDNPAVQAAYEALATEIQAQWDHIIASGVEMVPWTKEGQPYATSKEMADDVRVNKRLYFFTGGTPNRFMAKADANGLTINDKFRAVHDFFGHAAGGYGFGARGEENAWVSHSQMLSPQARRALTTETRGQNSWVNFGRQNYHPDGTYKNIPPGDRPFATQKAALLPDIYALLPGERALKWDESQHPRDEVGQFTRVAMTSQRPEDDPEHKENKEVFKHMRAFEQGLKALPGVSRVSVKPGVGGWNGGSESMWQIYYRGNGEARKLVARTAKQYNQDSVLVLNKCEKGADCQPAVELFFKGGISPQTREHIHATLLAHGITGWTWMKRDGKSLLRMVNVPPWSTWGADGVKHQQATATISRELHEYGIDNFRKVHKVGVSIMEREGAHSYDAIIGR